MMKIDIQAIIQRSLRAKLNGLVSRGIRAVEIDENGHLIFTLTDGSTVDLGKVVGDDGVSISSIAKTGTVGLVDTYTITMSDGTTSTFTVTNGQTGAPGADGQDGQDGQDGEDGNGIATAVLNADYTLTLTFTDGTSYTTPSIRGAQGIQGIQGPQGAAGADAKINGVNALTLSAGDGLSATQTGSTLTLSLDLDNYDGGAF